MNKKLCLVIIAFVIVLILLVVLIGIIRNNTSNKNITEDGELIIIEYNEKIKSNSKKLEQIIKLIKQDFDKNFDINNYEIIDESSQIGILFCINDVHMNMGYHINIENDYILSIISNVKSIDIRSFDKKELDVFNKDYSYLLDIVNNGLKNNNITIKKQVMKKNYDLITKEKYIVILTEYEKDGRICTNSYKKVIN